MDLDEFNYCLPKKLIAQQPALPRSASKLYITNKNLISNFNKLPKFLDNNDVLVINNTKVIPAVIFGKINQKKIKVTLHTKYSTSKWESFTKPSKLISVGDILKFDRNICAKVLKKKGPHAELLFNVTDKKLMELLSISGDLPIPPYIKKEYSKKDDQKNYQSIFSKNYGAFASPTASLHFDENLLSELKKKKIDLIETTLHVGAGTFLPLENNIVHKNKLHIERGYISRISARKITDAINNKKKIVAVGTTVLRLLESCFIKNSSIKYYNEETDLFIYPGFKFEVVNKLITNFHLPKSSLFILVSAFGGKEKVLEYYKTAIKKQMRFFSYGDGMIINRSNEV